METTDATQLSKREGRKRRLDVFLWSQEEGSTLKRPKLQESVEQIEVTYEHILKPKPPVQASPMVKIETVEEEVSCAATPPSTSESFCGKAGSSEAGPERSQVEEDIVETAEDPLDAGGPDQNYGEVKTTLVPEEGKESISPEILVPPAVESVEAETYEPCETPKTRFLSKRCPYCKRRINFRNEAGFRLHLDWHAKAEKQKKASEEKENADPLKSAPEADLVPLDLRKLETRSKAEAEEQEHEPMVNINIEEAGDDVVFKLQFDGDEQVRVRLWEPSEDVVDEASEVQPSAVLPNIGRDRNIITPEIALNALKSFAKDYCRGRLTRYTGISEAQVKKQMQQYSDYSRHILDNNGKDCTPAEAKNVAKNEGNEGTVEKQPGFDDALNLSVRKDHSSEKSYKCEVCSKKCASDFSLKRHLVMHGEKREECPVCGKKFARKQSMEIHSRIHTGEKPYECSFCNRKFRHSTQLTRHNKKLHDAEFNCSVCSKSFMSRRALESHLKKHTDEKPYACSTCGLKFLRSESCKKHEADAHNPTVTFDCRVCHKKFANRRTLEQHLKTHKNGKVEV